MAKVKKPIIILGIILVVLVVGIAGFIMSSNSVKLANDVTITIPKGAGANKIASILMDNDLIKNELSFTLEVKKDNVSTKLKPGDYTFKAWKISLDDIIQELVKGSASDTMNITIPEGLTVEEVATKLANEGIVDKAKFLDYAKNLDIPYDYIPQGNSHTQLDGFLFPETYNIIKTWDEKQIIDMMLKQFDNTFTEEWKNRAKELNMSIYDVVNLAAIVEREALFDSDRPIIAGVFHNRLGIPMRLQSCATVQYILGEQKPVLSYADIAIESPYNTYLHEGLPPTPIASPGASSIKATLYPEETDYLYFLAMPDGHHYFSKTLEEHNKAKDKYL